MDTPILRRAIAPCMMLFALAGCTREAPPAADTKPQVISDRASSSGSDTQPTAKSPPPAAERPGAPPPSPAAPTAKPHAYNRVVVLSIGINKYKHPGIKPLEFGETDATKFAELMGTNYGYEAVELTGERATRGEIGKKLRELGGSLGEKDALIVFFAGHGQIIELPSHGRAGFLVPYDAELDLEDRKDPEAWSAQALDMRGLVDMLRGMKAQHVVLIADACSSGFMTARGNFAKRPDLQVLLTQPSRMIMAAATELQVAREDPLSGHGRFTKALLDVLKGPDAASVTDVFGEVRKRVIKGTTLRDQWPQVGRLEGGDGEFVFIPLSIPKKEVELAFQGHAQDALGGVYSRAIARVAQLTQLGDVFEAFEANDYRFSAKPREREKVWQEKLERFQKNAQIGDVLAMAGLHYCYSRGLGTEKDEKAALHWARMAYDSGEAAGKHAYGRCLLFGIGVDKNEEAGWRLIQEASERGFAISHASMASHIADDQSIELIQRVRRSKVELEKAAAAGLATAQVRLAKYHGGLFPGSTRNMDEALKLLGAASSKGFALADWQLYEIHATGFGGVAKDPEKARDLLIRAAEDGLADAQFSLGCEYYKRDEAGLGAKLGEKTLPQSITSAARWAELGARQDHAKSLFLLSNIYEFGDPKGDAFPVDHAKAKAALEKAVGLNYAPALVRQGAWYADGKIYDQSDVTALNCFRRAAALRDANGCWMVGSMYEEARGMPLGGHSQMDMKPLLKHAAMHWYIQALILGEHPKAKAKLEDPSFLLGVNFDRLRYQFPESAKEYERKYGPRK